jgi:hypothetical protein
MGLLRNYDNYNAITSLNHKNYDVNIGEDLTTFGDGHLNVKTTGGVLRTVYYYHALPIFFCWGLGGSGCGTFFSFGSGTSPEHYDDYKLTTFTENTDYSIIRSSLKHTNVVYNEQDNTWENTITETYCALKDLKITEIGICHTFPFDSGGSRSSILVYRKLLDTPIEVPANTNFILSFTAKVSVNPNKPADYDASASVVD